MNFSLVESYLPIFGNYIFLMSWLFAVVDPTISMIWYQWNSYYVNVVLTGVEWVRGKMIPEKMVPGEKIPGKMLAGKLVSGKMDPGKSVSGKMVPFKTCSPSKEC